LKLFDDKELIAMLFDIILNSDVTSSFFEIIIKEIFAFIFCSLNSISFAFLLLDLFNSFSIFSLIIFPPVVS
jgi:hypothetical protein